MLLVLCRFIPPSVCIVSVIPIYICPEISSGNCALHNAQMTNFGQILSVGFSLCERCCGGDKGHGSLIIQICFHHKLQVTEVP